MTSNENITKSEEYEYLWDWLGKGLLTSTGPLWRSRRKLLTPTFHFKILEDFMPIFNEQSDVLVKVLREATDKEFINIFDVIIPCTLDVICGMFCGKYLLSSNLRDMQTINLKLVFMSIFINKIRDSNGYIDWSPE